MPVALNVYEIRDARTPAGDFFRAVRKQKEQYQGFWIVTPEGKVLSGHHEHTDRWTQEVRAALDEGLAKAGPLRPRQVEPRDVLPYWGKGVRDDGSVTLALTMRYMLQGKGVGDGALDAVTFSAEQFKAFAPPEAKAGKTWHLPGKIASEFSRTLSIVSDRSTMPRPDEVTEVDFIGQVARVRDGVATITYGGRIAALHTHTFNKKYVNTAKATLRGIGTYDAAKKEMRSLFWVLDGDTRLTWENGTNPIAAVVEWRRDAKR